MVISCRPCEHDCQNTELPGCQVQYLNNAPLVLDKPRLADTQRIRGQPSSFSSFSNSSYYCSATADHAVPACTLCMDQRQGIKKTLLKAQLSTAGVALPMLFYAWPIASKQLLLQSCLHDDALVSSLHATSVAQQTNTTTRCQVAMQCMHETSKSALGRQYP